MTGNVDRRNGEVVRDAIRDLQISKATVHLNSIENLKNSTFSEN